MTVAGKTVQAVRGDMLTPFALATETLNDTAATAADLKEAAKSLTDTYRTLGVEITKAAGQTEDAALKAALSAFAGAIDATVAAVSAAGTDRTKLLAATETDAFKSTERAVLDLCFDVLHP